MALEFPDTTSATHLYVTRTSKRLLQAVIARLRERHWSDRQSVGLLISLRCDASRSAARHVDGDRFLGMFTY